MDIAICLDGIADRFSTTLPTWRGVVIPYQLQGKTLPEYYVYDVPDTVTIKLENLPEGDYTLEVVAENCFGMQSAPLK